MSEKPKLIVNPWPNLKWAWQDAAPSLTPSRAAERHYLQQLKSVAGQVRHILRTGSTPEQIQKRLRAYAEAIGPWATRAAANMVSGVDRKNRQAWQSLSKGISAGLRGSMANLEIDGITLERLILWNANMVKNIPIATAQSIAETTRAAFVTGQRADVITADILSKEADMAECRARTIARTEISKASTTLTKARSLQVGCEGYIWRTSKDGDVRDSHKEMEGVYVPWETPPSLDNYAAHAGEFVNCRCYPEPVIPK